MPGVCITAENERSTEQIPCPETGRGFSIEVTPDGRRKNRDESVEQEMKKLLTKLLRCIIVLSA